MSVNLLDLFKDQISGSALKSISNMLGESESKTGSAMTGIAATLLGSLMKKASNTSGAASLLSDLRNADTGIFDNIGSLLGGDNKNSFLESGSKIVSGLLGDKTSSVIDAISSSVGLKKNSTSSLLSMAGPLVMGFLGKYVKSKNLNASGLMSLLSSQGDFIKKAVPSSLMDTLGFSALGGAATNAANRVSNTVEENKGGGFLKPLLLLIALLALGYWAYNKFFNSTIDHDDARIENTHDNGKMDHNTKMNDNHKNNPPKDDHADHNHSTTTTQQETAKTLNFARGSWAWTLSDFLANGKGTRTFTLDKVPFEGEEISLEAKEQLDNLAKILAAYPDVAVEIQGHTTKAKNAVGKKTKKAASKVRALWVKTKLNARGIDGNRLSSVGYGDEQLLKNVPEDDPSQKRIVVKFVK